MNPSTVAPYMFSLMLRQVATIGADIAAQDARIEQKSPHSPRRCRLDEIPGISLASGVRALAESAPTYPVHTAGHRPRAGLAPGVKESAGKKKGKGSTGHGTAYLARSWAHATAEPPETTRSWASSTAASPAAAAPSEPSSPSAARSWYRLAPAVRPRRPLLRPRHGYYATRIDPERRKQSHIRQLEALGYTVTLRPPPDPPHRNPAPRTSPGAAARPLTHQFSES